jgi:pimeloyl-ACP methyl ester carboxylesterase
MHLQADSKPLENKLRDFLHPRPEDCADSLLGDFLSPMTYSSVAAIVMLGVSSVLTLAQTHHAGELSLEPYSFRTYDGHAHPAELGHLWVQEDRSAASKGLIQVGFVRLRSTAQKPRSPIVFLPGGPGIPGSVLGAVPVYYELLEKLRALSDVILFDQRGIGASSPNTTCPEGAAPPADVFATESNFRKALVARATECAAYWRAKGLNLESFSTAASVEDLEDLRRAIGADKLSLLAHSYGTALALEFVRRHEEHVDRGVLAGVEGPDESLQLPSVVDFALRRLSDLAASSPSHDSFPDTYQEFQRVTSDLDRDPIKVRIRSAKNNQDMDLSVGSVLVRFVVRGMLGNGRRAGQAPALVYSLTRRDPSLVKDAAQDLYNSLTTGLHGDAVCGSVF